MLITRERFIELHELAGERTHLVHPPPADQRPVTIGCGELAELLESYRTFRHLGELAQKPEVAAWLRSMLERKG